MEPLYRWFQHLKSEGNKHGYYVNGSKTWLIVKSKEIETKANKFLAIVLTLQLKVRDTLELFYVKKNIKMNIAKEKSTTGLRG